MNTSLQALQTRVRLSSSRERNGSLCITVDSSQVLLVRRAIVRTGLHPIAIVKAAPIAGGTRVRMLIALAPHLIRPVEDAIVRALEPEKHP